MKFFVFVFIFFFFTSNRYAFELDLYIDRVVNKSNNQIRYMSYYFDGANLDRMCSLGSGEEKSVNWRRTYEFNERSEGGESMGIICEDYEKEIYIINIFSELNYIFLNSRLEITFFINDVGADGDKDLVNVELPKTISRKTYHFDVIFYDKEIKVKAKEFLGEVSYKLD